MTVERQEQHRRNPNLESVLQRLNNLLSLSEEKALEHFVAPKYPIIFIVGCARSGSTLLTQWLANMGHFAYPTNLLSRFYGSPYIGALVQQVLTNPAFDSLNELYEFHDSAHEYASALGKTRGLLAPHEFWYFWRRFFSFGEIQYLDAASLEDVDSKTFVAELAAIEDVFDKPMVMKGMIVNWNIEFINRIFPKVLFLHIQRIPLLNAQSLLEARRNFYGGIEHWYSFKPPEYENLRDLDPYSQVAGQVYFTNSAISKQLEKLNTIRWMAVDYEKFCAAPEQLYQKLLEKLAYQDWQPNTTIYNGPISFKANSELRLTAEECRQITEAYSDFSGEDMAPKLPPSTSALDYFGEVAQ